jgi:hypothetical protein
VDPLTQGYRVGEPISRNVEWSESLIVRLLRGDCCVEHLLGGGEKAERRALDDLYMSPCWSIVAAFFGCGARG